MASLTNFHKPIIPPTRPLPSPFSASPFGPGVSYTSGMGQPRGRPPFQGHAEYPPIAPSSHGRLGVPNLAANRPHSAPPAARPTAKPTVPTAIHPPSHVDNRKPALGMKFGGSGLANVASAASGLVTLIPVVVDMVEKYKDVPSERKELLEKKEEAEKLLQLLDDELGDQDDIRGSVGGVWLAGAISELRKAVEETEEFLATHTSTHSVSKTDIELAYNNKIQKMTEKLERKMENAFERYTQHKSPVRH